MTRPPPPLQQHLLTRSDLARMAVPATTVFRWLAAGSVEQIGDLPVAGAAKDPVFTVLHEPLRAQLAEQLAGIGKPTVVMTPLGVRSFLLRAMLRQREAGAEHTAREAPEQVASDVAAALDASMPADELATVLEHLAEEAAGDAVAMQHLAEQAVAEERAQAAPPAEDVLDETAGVEAADSEEAACFDFADLADEIESWHEAEPTTDEHGSDGEHTMKAEDTELANEADVERTADEALSFLDADEGGEHEAEVEHEAVAVVDEAERTAEEALSFLDADEVGSEPAPEAEQDAEAVDEDGERLAAAASSLPEADEAANEEEAPPTEEPAPTEVPAAAAEPADDASLTAAEVAAFGDDDASDETPSEPQPSEQAPSPSAAATTSVAAPVAAEAPIAGEAMARVESFLGELKSTLVELAGREQKPIDLQPIVQPLLDAVQSNTALTEVQTQALQAMQQSLATLAERSQAAAAPNPPVALAAAVAAPTDRSAMVMVAVAALVSCWAVVFWFTTGSKQLALGTLIGANALACCLLMGRRRGD
jgi:hypothetical protein